MVGELNTIYWINVQAEELEGEDGAFVTNIARFCRNGWDKKGWGG